MNKRLDRLRELQSQVKELIKKQKERLNHE